MAEWLSGVGRPACGDCIADHDRKSTPSRWVPNPKKLSPPCAKCKPEFHPLNIAAAALYSKVSGQWNFHPVGGNAVSLKISQVESAMRIYGVKKRDRPGLLDEVNVIASIIVDVWSKERERLKENG